MCDYNFGAVDVVSFVVAAISLVETTKDIYSWGVCEYGSEGGVGGCLLGVVNLA